MNYLTILFIGLSFLISHSASKNSESQNLKTSLVYNNSIHHENKNNMKLGAFSVSLNVKDINVSKQFYENLGFSVLGGDISKNYLIMKNENTLIGLFQGMFENNILTFNPGWDENGQNIENFNDIREIQQHLKAKGIKLENEIEPNTSGPASIIVTDPDGNVIYFDQHR